MYEIVIKDILGNYDSFRWHADEGQLDEVVEDCVDGLSNCLRGMQHEAAARVLPLDMVDNSKCPCESISGWFFCHEAHPTSSADPFIHHSTP